MARPAFLRWNTFRDSPLGIEVVPPTLLEKRAHQPFLDRNARAALGGNAYRCATAEITSLLGIEFGEFIAEVIGPAQIGLFEAVLAPWPGEILQPGVGSKRRGRTNPDFRTA